MDFLDKKKILQQRKKLAIETVNVPEWGGAVRVQEMTAEQRDTFDNWIIETEGEERNLARSKVVAMCVVDQDGKPIFSDLDIADIRLMSARAVMRIAKKAFELSGLGDESVISAEKNLNAAQSGDSSSVSAES